MPEQLPLPLPRRQAMGRADFYVSPANAHVLAMVETPVAWPERRLIITGPRGAGKTHLAHVFAEATGARVLAPADLTGDLASLAAGPVALDDAQGADEEALFHLYNLMGETGQPLLIASVKAPAQWGIALPDLLSRLTSVTVVELGQPDEALVTAVLAKQFDDRQISPPANLIPYLVTHMERSLHAAALVVEAIDREALKEGHPINRALAAGILDKIAASEP